MFSLVTKLVMEELQNLRFRWNDHVSHLSRVFSEQRCEEQYCDTSLITEDGYVIKAHRIILTMMSGYFEHILQHIDSSHHPIIVLNGTNFRELACVLDYIYQGMTQVDQHLMEAVLDVADMLEIKGLSKMKSNMCIKKLISPSSDSSLSKKSRFRISKKESNSPLLKTDIDENLEEKLKMDYATQESNQMEQDTETDLDSELPVQKLETMKSSSKCDQMLGIDLSISRNTPDENYKETDNHSNEITFKSRKVDQDTLPDDIEVSSASIDLEWEKQADKDEDEVGTPQPFKKHKIFGKSRNLATYQNKDASINNRKEDKISKDKSIHFTLEKLTTMFSKEKSSRIKYRNSSSTTSHNSKDALPPSVAILSDQVNVDPEVEVSCDDGGFTITVTTGPEIDSKASSYKNTNRKEDNRHVSLSLKKLKKRFRTKRDIEDSRKKWLINDRQHLMTSSLRRQPSRSSSRLKPESEERSSIKLSINCDPPFPSEDAKESDSEEKEESDPSTTERAPKRRFGDGSKHSKILSAHMLYSLPPTKEKEKQTRTSLTLAEKIKVIQAFLDGKSQRQIARLYGIGKTQVNGIVRKREEILSMYHDNLDNGDKLTMKRQRKSEYASLNQHLIKWYRHMTVVAGVKITTGMLRAKAMQLAPELGCYDFKGSNGWLATFKSNNNLKFSKTKKKSDCSKSSYAITNASNNESEDQDFFEESEDQVTLGHNGPSTTTVEPNVPPISTIHHQREQHLDVGTTSLVQGPGAAVSNISLSNSLLTATGSLPKPPQMGNMSLGSNLAYNLSREHTRTEMQTRSDIHHLGEIHPASAAVNPSSSALQKPDSALSYKSEEYGYDPQGRMNETSGASRTSEYNYTPYGFPSTYYGYHFLGQY